jgi:hypothetical protein
MPRQPQQTGSRKTIKKVNRVNSYFERKGLRVGKKRMPTVEVNSHRLSQFIKRDNLLVK